jgi:hypothetical protein
MKVLHAVFAIILLCGFTSLAKADGIDYRMNVLDPPLGSAPPSYPLYTIFSQPFDVVFNLCIAGELPPGSILQSGEGCFSAVNDTGAPLTSLEIVFTDSDGAAGQTPNCTFDSTNNTMNIFSSPSCNEVNGYFVNIFQGNVGTPGAIANGESFVITEVGVPVDQFPANAAIVPLGFVPPTPEPSSIVLLSTGVLMFGFVCVKRRKLLSAYNS